MPRKPRIQVAGGFFHVTAHGVDDEAIFATNRERRLHRILLAYAVRTFGWVCVAFCQMGSHFHLVLMTPEPNLAEGMQFLNGSYARYVNDFRDRTGHLFGGRYWSTLIETDEHLLETSRYVVLNPVRAGLCGRPEDWRWSSFAATAGFVRAPSFLDVGTQLALFSKHRDAAQVAYRLFVADGLRRDAPRP
jgi:putative transposase